ncbi:hypothetical protein O181_021624 [Austropuccinia psidii MF-1]|uniref:Uncharacterized protein n=1 Tax=Austropuccinia psidii MF-1 TaxID=1389203 RepID=A0A9Q3CDD2_9BASI|nr:hypothetical protein [Austropuccinia psidii MF-1]
MRPTTSPQGQVGPKPQVGPPEPILAPNSNIPKNGQKDPRTQIGQEPRFGHLSTFGHWKPPEDTSSSPARLPLSSGAELSFTNLLCTKGFRPDAYMVCYSIMHQISSEIQW